MSQTREPKKLADYVVIALNPALIMAMVGALVFFLVEVLYVGKYEGTLLYILFFFVFGGVLVSRMSIEFSDGRATLYGAILGLLTWLGTMRYVEYSADSFAGHWAGPINLFLLVVIWWSSHRLTWDCTVIDDSQDSSGVGLLQEAGLEANKDGPPSIEPNAASLEAPVAAPEKAKKKRRNSDYIPILAWYRRYRAYSEETERQPHAPGVWVVYFAFAALPLYGVGQSLIPPTDGARRQYAFWLMSVYVAAGLGLLLTTSFLGLRRYLRQKKIQMPWAITASWMSLGAALIVVFLLFGAILPRPAAEFALIQLPWQTRSSDLQADNNAVRGDEGGKGDSRRTVKGKDDNNKPKDGKGEAKGNAKADAKGKADGAKQPDGKEKGAGDKKDAAAPNPKEKAQEAQAKANEPDQKPGASMFEKASEALSKVAELLRPIVIGIIVLIVLFVVGRALLVFLANFTGWANGLLKFLQGFGKQPGAEKSEPEEAERAPAPPPFAEFDDPFRTGTAKGMSPAELVRYTFEALESWAWARDLARKPGETPLEFAARIGDDRPAMEDCVGKMANHYACLAYAKGAIKDDCRETMRECWQHMSGAIKGIEVAAKSREYSENR